MFKLCKEDTDFIQRASGDSAEDIINSIYEIVESQTQELKDKLRRRNMQIKELKKSIMVLTKRYNAMCDEVDRRII